MAVIKLTVLIENKFSSEADCLKESDYFQLSFIPQMICLSHKEKGLSLMIS